VIQPEEVKRIQEFIRRSGVVPIIEEVLSPKGTGRKSKVSVENWLTCLILTAIHGRTLHSSEVHRLFTGAKTPLRVQFMLGTREPTSGKSKDDKVVSISGFEARLRAFCQRISYLPSSVPGIDAEGAERAEQLQQQISEMLLAAFFPTDYPYNGVMLVDATAVETYGQFRTGGADTDARFGYRTPKRGERDIFFGHAAFVIATGPKAGHEQSGEVLPPRMAHHVVVRPANVDGGVGNPVLPYLRAQAQSGRLTEALMDSAWINTSYEGFWVPLQDAGARLIVPPKAETKPVRPMPDGTPMYYGFPLCPGTPVEIMDLARNLRPPMNMTLSPVITEEDQVALAAEESKESEEEMDLSPLAVADIPDEDVEMYEPETIKDQKAMHTRDDARKARAAKIDNIMRKLSYEERKRLNQEERHRAYTETMEFVEKSERIRQYALPRTENGTVANGFRERYECPALQGLVRCPLLPDSLLIDPADRPIVTPPNTGFCAVTRAADNRDRAVKEGRIAAGTQVPVLSLILPREFHAKLRTKYFPGTIAWIKDVTRRGRVEGNFGTLKSRSGRGLTKGYFAVSGQAAHSFLLTITLAAMNYLSVQRAIERGWTTTDPLYQPWPEVLEHDYLEPHEAEARRLAYLQGQADAGATDQS
jgi:hypothetical protein